MIPRTLRLQVILVIWCCSTVPCAPLLPVIHCWEILFLLVRLHYIYGGTFLHSTLFLIPTTFDLIIDDYTCRSQYYICCDSDDLLHPGDYSIPIC